MGSSVFHGGFSTFLAISVLGNSKSYIFVVFFKMWFGIIIFAMCNGFFLLPVVLSYIGPVDEKKKNEETKTTEEINTSEEEQHQKTISPYRHINLMNLKFNFFNVRTDKGE